MILEHIPIARALPHDGGSELEPFITLPMLRGGNIAKSHAGTLGAAQHGETPAGEAPFHQTEALQSPTTSASAGILFEVAEARRQQIERWGHTPEKDAEKPLFFFLKDGETMARALVEDHQFDTRELGRLRKRAVRLAAYMLATITRIDAEIELQRSAAEDLDPDLPL